MQYKGQLLLPDEPGPGLRVNLDVAEHHLAVESDGGGLGAWPLETVAVERLQGDTFALTVAGESLRFVADDTIAFTYSAVPTIERVSRRPKTKAKKRSPFRSMLERVWNGPEKPAETALETPATPQASAPSPEPATKPTVGEDVTEASPYLQKQTFDEIDIPSFEAEDEISSPDVGENADAATYVLRNLDLPFVEVDDQPEVDEPAVEQLGTFEAVDESPLAPGAEMVSESPSLWEEAVDPAGCPAIRSDGRRCESPILTSSGYCYPHDPKRALADKYQSAQEARARLKRDATDRLNRVYARLDKALRQVERGDLDPETAMAMAQLARTMCAILDIDSTVDE